MSGRSSSGATWDSMKARPPISLLPLRTLLPREGTGQIVPIFRQVEPRLLFC